MPASAPYRALLRAQWKHQRMDLWCLAVGCAMVAPIALWQTAAHGQLTVSDVRSTAEIIGGIGSMLAVVAGALLALRPYALDNSVRHTYALSLPLPRSRYALLRIAAGLTLLVFPVAGIAIGAFIAAAYPTLPAELHAYPIGLTLRFLVASVFAFAIAFSLQYGLGQRAAVVLAWTLAGVGALELVGQLFSDTSLTAPIWRVLWAGLSPLRIFGTNWMLFDV